MARSGQNQGSTKTKLPEYNGTWNLNHVEWLVEKFREHFGEIKARDVRDKYSIKRGERFIKLPDAEYRKLLELAVINGRAYSNGRPASCKKYAIYFNSINSSSDNEKLFDKELLLDPRIIDLPPKSEFYRVGVVDARSLECWVETKTYWTYLYQLICGFQKEGKVNLDVLPDWLDLHTKRLLGGEVKMYIYIYKALKFGWDKIPKAYKYKDNYNIIFIDILQACSSNLLSIKLSGFKLRSPSYRYQYLYDHHEDLKNQLQTSNGSLSCREEQDKLPGKFFGKEFDGLQKQVVEHFDRFKEMCGVLKKMLATSNDPSLHQILSEWEAVEEEYIKAYLGQSRLLKDNPRLENRNAKARKKRGFEV
jgi:hypothetical protein